ncbi:sigma-70 family RNA polymerase sigma factor [Streptomyces sp. NPDC052000]|uniref:RNA polymerase sigma factor n=1 Tax=Streptomyces sp. NPDC052000 TaxID=3155676 RepID=UPI00345062F1
MKPGSEEFSRFFAHWEPQVRRYLIWLDGDISVIDDATQETMISAFRYWERVSNHPQPRAWLFKVAGQRLCDAQVARRRAGFSTDPSELPDGAMSGAKDAFAVWDDRLAILDAVRKLPQQQAIAIALQCQHDLPLGEIAAVMGISAGSVKTHLHLARKTLKLLLGENEGGDQ